MEAKGCWLTSILDSIAWLTSDGLKTWQLNCALKECMSERPALKDQQGKNQIHLKQFFSRLPLSLTPSYASLSHFLWTPSEIIEHFPVLYYLCPKLSIDYRANSFRSSILPEPFLLWTASTLNPTVFEELLPCWAELSATPSMSYPSSRPSLCSSTSSIFLRATDVSSLSKISSQPFLLSTTSSLSYIPSPN